MTDSQLQTVVDGYQVSFSQCEPFESLKGDWNTLEKQTLPNVFLSWLWISTWLDSCVDDRTLVTARVTLGPQLVAMGLFCIRRETRHRLVSSTVAYLHQTGDEDADQIWIEYNGLLALPDHAGPALDAVSRSLLSSGLCEEVQLSMLPTASVADSGFLSRSARKILATDGYSCNLGALREQGADVLAALSGNTRHQLRRSLRRYEDAFGPLQMKSPQNAQEAIELLHEAGEWHRQRWVDSGFANPVFISFHEQLIKRGFDHGNVNVFRVSFGTRASGVFYFLIDGATAYFYLQGVRSETDGKLKPGLTGHLLVMQHFLNQGLNVYDFMGGDSQYKRQLSNQKTAFTSLRVHNNALKFRIEDKLRRFKTWIRAES